jgi:hypothetical protein
MNWSKHIPKTVPREIPYAMQHIFQSSHEGAVHVGVRIVINSITWVNY